MKIAIIENEAAPREAFRLYVSSLGFEDIETYDDVEDAMHGLAGVEGPLIVLLDHDFGVERATGYQLCRWLRQNHPFGMVLPIVYLTGRLGPEDYLEHGLERPFDTPTVYLAKARADEHLGALLKKFVEQFEFIERRIDEQAARRALASLARGDLPDCDDDGAA